MEINIEISKCNTINTFLTYYIIVNIITYSQYYFMKFESLLDIKFIKMNSN